MSEIIIKILTLKALGIRNVLRVLCYRIALKLNIHPAQRLADLTPGGTFFRQSIESFRVDCVSRDDWRDGLGRSFGKLISLIGDEVPDWFQPLGGGSSSKSRQDWWKIDDFDPEVGDIKKIWEASRFDWVLPMAQRAALCEIKEFTRLNDWLNDWSKKNPPFKGINWKCGQEASIRVIHLLAAAYILGQEKSPEPALKSLINIHLRRISATISYAIGQSNNHGTSEACALFVGGCFVGGKSGANWEKLGRKLLENRSQVLIESDGSFSQYSSVYHRLMLDTYSFAEVWRRKHQLKPFSDKLMQRLACATNWLEQITCLKTGEVPNLGANDGSQILLFTNSSTRDFRPSLQLASNLFRGVNIRAPKAADQQLKWFGIKPAKNLSPKQKSITFDDGGLHILRNKNATAYLRYPRFQFRPSQSDALHLDFWIDGNNVLRDGGSYSYNSSFSDLKYFAGTSSHNTVQFDGRDQMPRVGRFLFGRWLKTDYCLPVGNNDQKVFAAASYCDYLNAKHERHVSLSKNKLKIKDIISGFKKSAIMRWRLAQGQYSITDNIVTGEGITISINSSMPIVNMQLVSGEESIFYLNKSFLPVVELHFDAFGEVETILEF